MISPVRLPFHILENHLLHVTGSSEKNEAAVVREGMEEEQKFTCSREGSVFGMKIALDT